MDLHFKLLNNVSHSREEHKAQSWVNLWAAMKWNDYLALFTITWHF